MNVDQQIDTLIEREGDYVNHPADRGGPTRFGVTEQAARAYGYLGNMRSFPRTTAAAIYRERYWTAVHFDQVAPIYASVAEELFDTGVNMGQAVAAKFLQRALNLLNRRAADYPDILADGLIGRMTINSLNRYKLRRPGAEGEAVLLWMVKAFRTGRYAEIAERDPTQEAFEYGWIARQVRAAA
jgi:lysozyme family protein